MLGSPGAGRTKRPSGEPEIPEGLQENIQGRDMPNPDYLKTVTLRDISYDNSLTWLYSKTARMAEAIFYFAGLDDTNGKMSKKSFKDRLF